MLNNIEGEGPLHVCEQWVYIGIVGQELGKRGLGTQREQRRFGEGVDKLSGRIRRLVEGAYLMGQKDAASRFAYGTENVYLVQAPFAIHIREGLEEKFTECRDDQEEIF